MSTNSNVSTSSNDTFIISIIDPICKKYIYNIRNITPLSINDLQHVNNLCENDRLSILLCYNEMVYAFKDFLEQVPT